MINKYKIYPEYQFGFAKLTPGDISFERLFDFAREVREDPNFTEIHYMLTDLRGVKFNFGIESMYRMIKLVKKYSEKDKQKMGIYLLDAPMETVIVKLFFNAMKRKRDYCFTVEKAYSLFNLSMPLKKFIELTEI